MIQVRFAYANCLVISCFHRATDFLTSLEPVFFFNRDISDIIVKD